MDYIPGLLTDLPIKELHAQVFTAAGLTPTHIPVWPASQSVGRRAEIALIRPTGSLHFAVGTNIATGGPDGMPVFSTETFNVALHPNIKTLTIMAQSASSVAQARITWIVVR